MLFGFQITFIITKLHESNEKVYQTVKSANGGKKVSNSPTTQRVLPLKLCLGRRVSKKIQKNDRKLLLHSSSLYYHVVRWLLDIKSRRA